MKAIVILLYLLIPLMAQDIRAYQYSGVEVIHQGKPVVLQREISPKCLNVPLSNDYIWEDLYENDEVPKECKTVFLTTAGQIQAMSIHPKIETYGEMEVLQFTKQMQGDDSLMFVDARDETWFGYRTIPGAVNIPHYYISQAKEIPKVHKESLIQLGVKVEKDNYDFSNVKTILLFGNGAWCRQSSSMINDLLALGYPAEKMKWYRGGMHAWLTLSMTATNIE